MEEGQNNQFLSNGSMDSAAPTSVTPPTSSPTVASKSSIENAQYMTNVIEKKPNIFKRFGKKAAEVFKKLNQPINKKPKSIEMPTVPAVAPETKDAVPAETAVAAAEATPKPATPKKVVKLPKLSFKKPDFSNPKTKKTAIIIGVIAAAALVIALIILAIIKAQSLAGGSLASDGSNLSELYLPQPSRKTEQLTQEEMEIMSKSYDEILNKIVQMKEDGDNLEKIASYLDVLINESATSEKQVLWFNLWMRRYAIAYTEEGNLQKALKYLDFLDVDKLSVEQQYSVYSDYIYIYQKLENEEMVNRYKELTNKIEQSGKLLGIVGRGKQNA